MTPSSPLRPRRSLRSWWVVPLGLGLAVLTAACSALVGDDDGRDGGRAHLPPGLVLPSTTGDPDGRIGDAVVTAADDDVTAVARLDPDLLRALVTATHDAARDGIEVRINSGWRSRAYQQDLLEDAVQTYGSLDEARRWVSTPDESAHTRGDAVDVGPTDAAYWMSRYGATYGLCQVYANEIWHYELLTEPGGTCPELHADGGS